MSFLEGIDLSDAAVRAIKADLELRRKDPRVADRFYRYHYTGGADLLLQHGRSWQGRVRPERYAELAGVPGDCYGASHRGAQADHTLTYVEGYCTVSAGLPFSHAWCVAPDGEVVDLALPCGHDQLEPKLHPTTRLPVLHPIKWGYFGVLFTTELVTDHDSKIGLPLLDRSFAENREVWTRPGANPLDYAETHDNPILKVAYDPARTSIEGISYKQFKPTLTEDEEWDDEEEDEDDSY